jgi:hypothetical protein
MSTIVNTSTTITQDLLNSYLWPVIINGGTSSNIITITLGENIVLNNVLKYFKIGSEYIIFEGNNFKVTINGVTGGYPGLIQNGTSSTSGYSNTTIQNIAVLTSNGSILGFETGWICQSYYSRNSINNLVQNCYSTGNISDDSGGICGSNAGYINGKVTIYNCYSTGNIIGLSSGGICGSNTGRRGLCTITNCYSIGIINSYNSGGICGSNTGNNGSCNITKCYSTGNISSNNSGGICGNDTAANNGSCSITNCYSTGSITGDSSGGICGPRVGFNGGDCTITNVYVTGQISGQFSDAIVGPNSIATINNTYITYSNPWSDSDAISTGNLTDTPTYTGSGGSLTLLNPIGTVWATSNPSTPNLPYIFASYGLSPYTNPTATLNPGETSQQANVITGVTYSLIAISNSSPVVPSTYPFITINSSNGAITVGMSVVSNGSYTIYVYQINNTTGGWLFCINF